MERRPDEEKMIIKKPLLEKRRKGGWKTIPFVIANEGFEKMAAYGLLPSMILYMMGEYHMEAATGATVIFLWSAASNFTPVVGAFLADTFFGRYFMIGSGSFISFLGVTILWLTAMIPQARPPPCAGQPNTCNSATALQLSLLFSSLALMSIGAGGIRSSSMAFGADQLDVGSSPECGGGSSGVLETYFSWYYASTSFSIVSALAFVVYVTENMGWRIGFGVTVGLLLLSSLSFFIASPFYVKLKARSSLLTGFGRVVAAAYSNRHLELPSPVIDVNVFYHPQNGSMLVPTDKLRFLNKACIIKNSQQDMIPGGTTCPNQIVTVDQVEELKALLKVIPLWSTGMVMSVNISQTSVVVLQATSMDRTITPTFQIPAGSFNMFIMGTVIVWIALYDRVILPVASKIAGKPVRCNTRQRMGIGILVSCLSMAVAAIVEGIRRRRAIDGRRPDDVVEMSAMWLVPQHCLLGLAEALNVIAQMEFYFLEFPRSMSSIATTLFGVGMSAADLLASFIMNAVDGASRRVGKESWVSSDVNKGHYDYYYWILAALSFVNLIYFLVCCAAYGSFEDEKDQTRVEDDEGRRHSHDVN